MAFAMSMFHATFQIHRNSVVRTQEQCHLTSRCTSQNNQVAGEHHSLARPHVTKLDAFWGGGTQLVFLAKSNVLSFLF